MQRGNKKNRILDFWVGIPLLNLLATPRTLLPQNLLPRNLRHRNLPRNPSKIGLLCSPALGDTLLVSSVLQDLRAHFPHAEIVHFCMRESLAAAELIPGADRRVVINLTQPAATLALFRGERLDALFDFSSWQRLTAFYSLLSGAKFTAGFRTAGQHRGRGYDLAVEHTNDRHEVENFRAILRALNLPTGAPPRVIVPPAPQPEQAPKDLIVFHLWASGQRSWLREWPEDRWLELAHRLARPGTVFAITGAPSDLPRTQPFVDRLRAAGLAATAFTGTDGFASLARMLLAARVTISVNTGVMHLAAILGVPTVSLNGPTNGLRWGPVGPHVANVAPADGSGGYLNLGFEYDGQPEDLMQRIPVQQVVDSVDTLLAKCAA